MLEEDCLSLEKHIATFKEIASSGKTPPRKDTDRLTTKNVRLKPFDTSVRRPRNYSLKPFDMVN